MTMIGQRVKALSLGALAGIVLVSLMGPSGGLPTRPKFSAVGIGTSAPTTGQLDVSNATDARVFLSESGATADNRKWGIRATGEQLHFQATNDALGSASWLTVDRTGTTVDSLDLTATTINAMGALQTPGQLNFLTGISGYHEFVNRNAAARGYKWYTGANGTVDSMTLSAAGALTVSGFAFPKVYQASINSGGTVATGYGISSTRLSPGVYRLTFASTFSDAPAVTATIRENGPAFISTDNLGTGAVDIRTYNTAGVATDYAFQVIAVND